MTNAQTLGRMSPQLQKVVERAQREPDGQFHSLAHLLDESALARAFHRLRSDAAVGVDGITKEQYGRNLEENLRTRHERLKTKPYRHQPIRRVPIPKDKGKTRPIGLSTLEDKIVQGARREVLEAIYEQDFMENSYGFRPGRRAHDALRALYRIADRGEVNWVLEADIVSFFDSLDRTKRRERLQRRVIDGSIHRLLGKCLQVGVLDGEEFMTPDTGTVQGSVLSPWLGNLYLHYTLDLWFEREIKPKLQGKAHLIRYGDDFIITFERPEEAEQVMKRRTERMRDYGRTRHPEKTRWLPFRRPLRNQTQGKGPATFDFLGFTLYWQRTRKGTWGLHGKTRHARRRRAIQAAHDGCRRHRHRPIREPHEALKRRIQGHFNYFGVNGNIRSLARLNFYVTRVWYKWLRRRSQKTRLTGERMYDLLKDFPLPRPRIIVQIWGV